MSKKREKQYSTIRFKKEVADKIRTIAIEDGRKIEVAAELLIESAIKERAIKNLAFEKES